MTIHLRDGQLTMTLSPRSSHVFKLGIIVFLITTTAYYLFFEVRDDVHDVYQVAVTGRKGAFVQGILENEIDGPFDGRALAALCSTKKWTPGLIFKCEAPQGGIGNVRNVFMNCVRYAIEAGATGFIVPEIMDRGPTPTDLDTERLVPFTYFFDHDHFITSLHSACPHMHIYNHQNDLWDMPSTASPVRLKHPQLTSNFHPQAENVILDPSNWVAAFNKRLNKSHPAKFSESKPVLISLHTPLLQWPIDYDDPTFIATFGRIFRFREDVRRLAATVLYAMDKKYQLGIDPKAPGIQDGKFYGAHLRTAVDAASAEWTPYAIQSNHYLSHAAHNHLPLIYVASGSPPNIMRLSEEAANNSFPMEVTMKSMLLEGKGYEKERNEMSRLTWDQQGLVDYEVMLRASRFGGTWESSFGWNLAMRRHVAMGRGTWIPLEHASTAESAASESSEASKPATMERPEAGRSEAGSSTRVSKPANPTGVVIGAKRSRTSKLSGAAASERRRRAGSAEEKTAQETEGEISKRDLPTGPQAFSDAYSIIFGDVTPAKHPGVIFELALWP